ncbi:DUF1345 domain-containing protein [Dactylosporangium roseum]|uniref:DUF1345 domain-containing protein n=1 Tax=Dactylosporangium roseum TaxID=47989 RepID=A0ABY5YXQ9_9ACTN|nr:DUF1345 domain-containing protein [Dactylosporangium roseum]UWZ34538.1 DUF1345 domain-containing protein [Dactylosporangium roseum]
MGSRAGRPAAESRSVGVSARRTALIAAGGGLLVAAVAAVVVPRPYVPLIGWDAAAVVFLLVTWRRIARMDVPATAAESEREDPTRAGADLGLLIAAVVSLAAVGVVVAQASSGQALVEVLQIGLGVGSVVASWAVVHTIYTLAYARLYYAGRDGGVDFHDLDPDSLPQFSDFAYLSFTVGMTFQVSDTELRTAAFRSAVLRQALLSYLFGTVIVALTINLVAGLSR